MGCVNDFDTWNKKKKEISASLIYKHPKAQEIWHCRVGINVGCEIYGKGSNYVRPVLVINDDGEDNFIGVPLTSKIKNTKYSRVIREEGGKLATALTYQIRSFDKRRLIEKHSTLSDAEFDLVCQTVKRLVNLKRPN